MDERSNFWRTDDAVLAVICVAITALISLGII